MSTKQTEINYSEAYRIVAEILLSEYLLRKIETYETITFNAITLAFIWSKSLVIHLPRENYS